MRRRKEIKVRRTWKEKQKDWMKYWCINKSLLAVAIWFWLAVLVGLLLCFLIAPHIYEQYEAEAKELESQMDFSAYTKEQTISQIKQSKWEKKIPKYFTIRIKSSEYRVTLTVHFVRRDGKMIVHCITNNAELTTIKCFGVYMVISILLLAILTIPIYYFLCFSIFLFTEVMSRLQRRREP